MGMGLEPMTALLTSEPAGADGYEKAAGERNGGGHAKTTTTVFGGIAIPARTCFTPRGTSTDRDGKQARTRDVKLGAVFPGHTPRGGPHRDEDSTTHVATAMRWREFGALLRREFDRRCPLAPETTVFLADGGKWPRSVHDDFFPFATMALDLFHALEHLKGILGLLGFEEGSDASRKQSRAWKNAVKAGRIKSVVKKIEAMASGKNRAEVGRRLQYCRDNFDRMKYDEYAAHIWFVGSGVVER